jgi:N-carbamoyl-L-amino-acid hydrolase
VHFALDIRSMSDAEASGFLEYAQRYAGDTVYWDDIVRTPSAWLDPALRQRALDAATRLGIKTRTMASGAGHDAAVFQQSGVPSGMVFVRNQGGSHNPHEDMNIDDFMLGVEVLWGAIR